MAGLPRGVLESGGGVGGRLTHTRRVSGDSQAAVRYDADRGLALCFELVSAFGAATPYDAILVLHEGDDRPAGCVQIARADPEGDDRALAVARSTLPLGLYAGIGA